MRWIKLSFFLSALLSSAPASAVEKISAEDAAAIASLVLLKDGAPAWLDIYLGEPFGLEDCDYGPIYDDDVLELRTGDTHFLVTVAPSDPSRHPQNLASCEYSLQDASHAATRLRGCFIAHWVSIPTARQLTLHPLDVAYCQDKRR